MPSHNLATKKPLHDFMICITHQCPEDLRHIKRELVQEHQMSSLDHSEFLLPQPQKKGQAESSGAQFRWDQRLSKTPEFSLATMNYLTCLKQHDLLLWGTLGKEAPSRSQLRETNPNDFTGKGEDIHSVSWELEVLVCSSEVEHLPSVQEALSAIPNTQNIRIVQFVLL